MAPQAGQIDKVGAKLRSHTGQFIGVFCKCLRIYEANFKK